jgi:hypothetical protein
LHAACRPPPQAKAAIEAAPPVGGTDAEAAGWAIEKLSRGYIETGTLFTAATLGIAYILADGPMRVSAIAEASGTDAPMLQRMLIFSLAIGVFKRVSVDSVDPESIDASYGNSAASDLLRSGTPNSVRSCCPVERCIQIYMHACMHDSSPKVSRGESLWYVVVEWVGHCL